MTAFAVHPDGGTLVALRGRMLAALTVEPFAIAGRIELDEELPGASLAFVGRHVLIHATSGACTRLRVAQVAGGELAITARLDLERGTRLLGANDGYALLADGDQPLLAACTAGTIGVAPLRAAPRIRRAVALEHARFLLWSDRDAQIWDAVSQRPQVRVALALPPDTAGLGAIAGYRSLWISRASPELAVARLSDGKLTTIDLPAPARGVTSHPLATWIVVDVANEISAINGVLRTASPLPLPAGSARAVAPMAGASAWLIADLGERLVRLALGAEMAARELAWDAVTALEPPPVVVRSFQPAALAPADHGLDRPAAPAAVEPGDDREPAAVASVVPPPPEVASTPTAPPRRPVPPLVLREASARASAYAPPPRSPAPVAPPSQLAWRDELVAWVRRASGEPPDSGRMGELAERAGLTSGSRRALALLYADWLAGNGATGLAAIAIVDRAPPGERAEAWHEALGTGPLAALGLVTARLGRLLLAPAAGDYLDGRAPCHIELVGEAPLPAPAEPGIYRMLATTPRAAAQQLASDVPVGFHRQGAEFDAARGEAWLHGRVLVTGAAEALGAVARPGETIVVSCTAAADPGPPIWHHLRGSRAGS